MFLQKVLDSGVHDLENVNGFLCFVIFLLKFFLLSSLVVFIISSTFLHLWLWRVLENLYLAQI